MGEHSTWWNFLDYLPGWQNLTHSLEHTLGRGPGTAHPWTFGPFGETTFSLAHVLSAMLVSLFLIFGAVALFAVLLPLVGLALTSFALVLCAGFAAYDVRFRENAIAALILAAFAVVLFVMALGLPIKVWPW